jgi:hypothetical protein
MFKKHHKFKTNRKIYLSDECDLYDASNEKLDSDQDLDEEADVCETLGRMSVLTEDGKLPTQIDQLIEVIVSLEKDLRKHKTKVSKLKKDNQKLLETVDRPSNTESATDATDGGDDPSDSAKNKDEKLKELQELWTSMVKEDIPEVFGDYLDDHVILIPLVHTAVNICSDLCNAIIDEKYGKVADVLNLSLSDERKSKIENKLQPVLQEFTRSIFPWSILKIQIITKFKSQFQAI